MVSIQRVSWRKELKSDLLFLSVNSFSSILRRIKPADAVILLWSLTDLFVNCNQERLPRLCSWLHHWGAQQIAAKALHASRVINQRFQSRSFYCIIFFLFWAFSAGHKRERRSARLTKIKHRATHSRGKHAKLGLFVRGELTSLRENCLPDHSYSSAL